MSHDKLCCDMRAKIDHAGLQHVNELYPGTTWQKFFDVDLFVHAAAQHALRLNIELKQHANCIDIGAGFGYVALALECLGHQCTAWDAPAEVLQAIAQYIPVHHRIFKTVERGKPTQPITRDAFDLIILHGVWPMRDAAGWWQLADYAAFVNQLAYALAPGGRVEIIVNRGDQLGVCTNLGTSWKTLRERDVSIAVSDNVIDVRRAAPLVI